MSPLSLSSKIPLLSKSPSATSSSGDSEPAAVIDAVVTSSTYSCGPHKPLAVLAGHAGPISCLALCGEFVLSASSAHDIIVWQLPDLRQLTRFNHSAAVKSLAAAGPRLFSAHHDSRIRVWSLSAAAASENLFKLAATLPTKSDCFARCLRQSNYVQTRRHHRKLWIEHADTISCLAVHAGLVYSGSWDKTLKVWSVSGLKYLESIKAHDDAINAIAAHDGLVYSASADGKIKIWGVNSGKKSHFLKGSLGCPQGVCWNAVVVCDGGRRVYAGGSDGRVMGWEEMDDDGGCWKVMCDVRAHEKAVLCLCSTRGGEFLCSGSADKRVGVWRREGEGRLKRVAMIGGHEGPVKCVQASDMAGVGEGFMLYSGGLDGRLRVWWVPKEYGEGKEGENGMKRCVLVR